MRRQPFRRQLGRHQLGRRQPLTRARVALLLSLGLLAGCAGPAEPAGPSDARDLGDPVSGGTLVFAMQQEPYCINAHQGPQFAAQFINRPVVDSLVAQDPTDGSRFLPWLATSWEATPDARQYTFKLREDVTFHNGEKFNAEAVKANFDLWADPSSKASGSLNFLGGTNPFTTEVLGEYEIRISFTRGHAAFLQAASTPYLGIQAPSTLAHDGACNGPVGSGPFIFDGYTRQGSFVVKRNPDYQWGPPYAHHSGPAYLDGIEFRFVPEDATRTGALTSKQVDAADGAAVRQLDQLQRQGFSLVRSDQPGGTWMAHLNTERAPLNDVEVRRALREAIDLDGLVTALWGGKYERAWGPLSPYTPGYNPAVEGSWSYSEESANRRLDAAGWTGRDADGFRAKDGQRLTVTWILEPNELREQRPDFAQLVKEQVRKVGIDLQVVQVSANESTARRTAGDYDLYAYAYVRAEPDQLARFFHGGSLNFSRTKNAQIDEWLDTAVSTTDIAARHEAYGKVQEYVIDQALVLPFYVQSQLVFFGPNVHGITTDATGWIQFYDAWKQPA